MLSCRFAIVPALFHALSYWPMTFDDPLRLLVLLIVLLLGLVFAAGAIARPRIKVSEPQSNATVILLVDVSGSMNSTDVKPTRLDAAVRAMSGFLDKLPSQFKVGLVAFSTELEPLVSPTTNRDLVKQAIGLLEPEAGTALGDGIAAALHILTSSLKDDGYVREPGKPVPGTIVLLSDGAQNRGVLQPVQAALLAKKDGIRIYPVSLGTPDGTVSYGVGAFVQRVRVPPRPADDERDRADHEREVVHRTHRLQRAERLPNPGLTRQSNPQAASDRVLVRRRGRRSAARGGRSRRALLEPPAVTKGPEPFSSAREWAISVQLQESDLWR